jgi:electron transfer flavoprotein beta subunit
MRIVVCLKQVLDLSTVRVSSRGELDTREAAKTTNPADLCALEEALTIKEAQAAEVIALTLGDADAEDVLREALAVGADRAILLCDDAFAGCDAHGVSHALAGAVATIGGVDLVLTGDRSSDDGGGQVGAHIAEELGWAQLTAAHALDVAGGRATAVQVLEDGCRHVSVPLPAVVSVANVGSRPRLAHIASIMNAYRRSTVDTWSAADIRAALPPAGGAALTVVRRTFAPDAHDKGDIIAGTPADAARSLVSRLRQRSIIE